MKRNNKIKIGNLLKIKNNFGDHCIGLIIDATKTTVTVYFTKDNRAGIRKYCSKKLSNISKLMSAKPWKVSMKIS